MAKGKPVEAWATKSPNCLCEWLVRGTAQETRKAAVAWMADVGVTTWPQLYRRGWRVVKVRVEEVG